jgi:hypothetical protein
MPRYTCKSPTCPWLRSQRLAAIHPLYFYVHIQITSNLLPEHMFFPVEFEWINREFLGYIWAFAQVGLPVPQRSHGWPRRIMFSSSNRRKWVSSRSMIHEILSTWTWCFWLSDKQACRPVRHPQRLCSMVGGSSTPPSRISRIRAELLRVFDFFAHYMLHLLYNPWSKWLLLNIDRWPPLLTVTTLQGNVPQTHLVVSKTEADCRGQRGNDGHTHHSWFFCWLWRCIFIEACKN